MAKTDRFHKQRSWSARLRRVGILCAGLVPWLSPVPGGTVLCGAACQASDEPPPFDEVCFEDFDDSQSYPGEDYLRRMLAPLPGQPGSIGKTTRHDRPICSISGVLRMKPPWRADSVLRLALFDQNQVQVHFWRGNQGVTFRYYPNNYRSWAAYGTTRRTAKPQPETDALWAVDNGRYCRSRAGTFEVRYQDRKLVMTRGDLVLCCVPFPGPPGEVYLQGEAKVRGLAMLRSRPAPLPTVSRPLVLRIDNPAEVNWELRQHQGETEVKLNKLPDGRVELLAENADQRAQAGAAICGKGLYEYIFEVQQADPGTGIYLGDERGRQLYRVGFFRHNETGRTIFGLLGPDDHNSQRSLDFRNHVTPFAGPHQWIRVVVGAGMFKGFTSGDGIHWSEFHPNGGGVQGGCTAAGLFCSPWQGKRAIKLRSVEVRRLDAVASLVPQRIVRRVGSLAASKNVEDWHQRVAESQPADVGDDVWRRACALRTISENVTHSVSQPVLHDLLDDVLAKPGDWQFKLRLLDEACLLVNFTNYGDFYNAPKYAEYYSRLGKSLIRQGHPAPFTTASRAIMRMPGWEVHRHPFDQELLRYELLCLAQRERWPELAEFSRRLKYWTRVSEYRYSELPWQADREATLHLLGWADAQVSRHAPRPPEGKQPAAPGNWRHPLIERVSKEGYNVLAELSAAVDGKAYREACQTICEAVDPQQLGLLPQREDSRMLVSLPMAVDLAMERVPALDRAMQEHFASLGQLRVKQAIADGDPAAVEAVALRFPRTAAASEARRWLGDRHLSCGQFARACGQYKRALRSGSAAAHTGLLARLRLAVAMLGGEVGRPITGPVEFGPVRLSAGQFEQMVRRARDARRRPDGDGPAPGDTTLTLPPCPPPGKYQCRNWARIDGTGDKQPDGLPREGFDWAGRQLAAVVAGGQMIVNNQVRHVAFDIGSGRRRWLKRRELHKREGRWSVAPMRPVVDRGRIFVRWLGDEGPEPACFSSADGTLLWSGSPTGPVVSDPLLVGRDLFLLGVRRELGSTLSLELAGFDRESGELRSRALLATFRDHWSGAIPCRATLADDEIVATVGGAVLCASLSGRVRFIRRQVWAPPPKNPSHARDWFRQLHDPPLVADRRIYAAQPGVWAIECIDLDTGRLLWRTPLPEMIALAGRLGPRLIVPTTDGLLAVDADSGRILWRHNVEDRLDARVSGTAEAVCYARLGPADPADANKPRRPVLVWLDPETGQITAESTLEIPIKDKPLFGPLVVHGNRQWVFATSGDRPAAREILELVPVKP